MPAFGKSSRANLAQCHPELQRLFNDVIKYFDCSVICGHRGKEEQDAAFENGDSLARFGESLHNFTPALAVDVVPYPLNWDDHKRFALLSGFVQGRAIALGINIRWGGDWDQDDKMDDERFLDMPHYELLPPG